MAEVLFCNSCGIMGRVVANINDADVKWTNEDGAVTITEIRVVLDGEAPFIRPVTPVHVEPGNTVTVPGPLLR